MKYTKMTEDAPGEIKFGDLLTISLFRHMIDFEWISETISFSFAWWARGNEWSLFKITAFEISDYYIFLFAVSFLKIEFSITWNK